MAALRLAGPRADAAEHAGQDIRFAVGFVGTAVLALDDFPDETGTLVPAGQAVWQGTFCLTQPMSRGSSERYSRCPAAGAPGSPVGGLISPIHSSIMAGRWERRSSH
ncbi:MAG: hypothetical protein M5R42_19205 [Rhodocyclaceae bacterium]|nr:hypothetical protein [Rhodocyclaceae bacterium]